MGSISQSNRLEVLFSSENSIHSFSSLNLHIVFSYDLYQISKTSTWQMIKISARQWLTITEQPMKLTVPWSSKATRLRRISDWSIHFRWQWISLISQFYIMCQCTSLIGQISMFWWNILFYFGNVPAEGISGRILKKFNENFPSQN